MDHTLGRMSESSACVVSCVVSFAAVGIGTADLDFADDVVIFEETTEVLSAALESVSEKAELLGLRVSSIQSKVQAFGNNMDKTICIATVFCTVDSA